MPSPVNENLWNWVGKRPTENEERLIYGIVHCHTNYGTCMGKDTSPCASQAVQQEAAGPAPRTQALQTRRAPIAVRTGGTGRAPSVRAQRGRESPTCGHPPDKNSLFTAPLGYFYAQAALGARGGLVLLPCSRRVPAEPPAPHTPTRLALSVHSARAYWVWQDPSPGTVTAAHAAGGPSTALTQSDKPDLPSRGPGGGFLPGTLPAHS